ncbi:zinc finger homeobox protein 3-like [Neoarius graeffei]|uniref:zinc finger homeobox protein 3-like n=1 Tax=Neoarius graeffei TaxID=443677 RepID=UPI00298D453E|nr:zinc finger homeobox protein 3-like [Neoarius graeffei]
MYVVVSFPAEGLFFVVPVSWLIEDKCYWPPFKTLDKVKKAALQNETPDPNCWTLHPVEVLKVKDTYEKAHGHYLKAKRGEKLETDEETMKRKRKPNMKFIQSSDEEDDRPYFPPAPKIRRLPEKISVPNSEFTSQAPQVPTTTTLPLPPPPQLPPLPPLPQRPPSHEVYSQSHRTPSVTRTSTYPAVLSNQAASPPLETSHLFLTSSHGEFTSQAPQLPTTTTLPLPPPSPLPPLPQLPTISPLPAPPQLPSKSPLFRTSSHGEFTSQAQHHPSNQQISIQQDFCRLVLQHLRTIEEEVKEVKQQVAANTAILQKLGGAGVADLCLVQETNMPLSNLEELEELERQLGSDIDLKNQLVNILAVLGGKTTKDAVKRMLGRILRKSLALQINWTGAGGKVAFKSLHLKNVLHRAVRRVVHTATEEDLQKEVAKYLKGAVDREGGRKDRQKKVGNGEMGEYLN